MSRWNDFVSERREQMQKMREHREIRKKLKSDDFDLV